MTITSTGDDLIIDGERIFLDAKYDVNSLARSLHAAAHCSNDMTEYTAVPLTALDGSTILVSARLLHVDITRITGRWRKQVMTTTITPNEARTLADILDGLHLKEYR